MKETIQRQRGDLNAAQNACADMQDVLIEVTRIPPSTASTLRKRAQDSDVFESLEKKLAESGTIPKNLYKAEHEMSLQTMLKRAFFPCPGRCTRRQGLPSIGYCMYSWMTKAMMILQLHWQFRKEGDRAGQRFSTTALLIPHFRSPLLLN